MKFERKDYIRLKVYAFILLYAFFMGWKNSHRTFFVESTGTTNSHYMFNYFSFSSSLFMGFSITLLFDLYRYYFQNKKSKHSGS